jgi:hypothetical protein
VSQTVNDVTTNHVLDQAAGLTQVLEDGTNTYLYGNGRIAQDDGVNMGYFLGDRRSIIAPTCSIPEGDFGGFPHKKRVEQARPPRASPDETSGQTPKLLSQRTRGGWGNLADAGDEDVV